jgi:predicted glutamine amidotransferase
MCQLLGMNSNVPHDICFSFEGFHLRGGKTDEHRDGWGIAFFEGKGCRVFMDSRATIDSPVAQLVRQYPIRSINVVAHIRKATRGAVSLENTHPFVRELWGRYWVFAHNGTLKGFAPKLHGRFQPVGQTDSELAFCYIMELLYRRFLDSPPSLEAMYDALLEITECITPFGEFNYLLSNGDWLFAFRFGRNLGYVLRRAPFKPVHLIDQDLTVDFSQVASADDKLVIIASAPLTDNETWVGIEEGSLLAFDRGEPVSMEQPGQVFLR